MSTCYIFSETGKKLSQQEVLDQIGVEVISNPDSYSELSNTLFSKSIDPQEQVTELIESLHKNKKGSDYEGVSHFLD